MHNAQAARFAPQNSPTPRILKPDPQWFLVRGVIWGLIVPLFLTLATKATGLGLLFALGVLIMWLVFRNSSITLDNEGFTYRAPVKTITHRWVDIESFCVVEQRMLHFIPVSRYLGWNFSPAYKNYKLLAIPRTVAKWVGMSHAMFKPVGFNVPELAKVMNEHLHQVRGLSGAAAKPEQMLL